MFSDYTESSYVYSCQSEDESYYEEPEENTKEKQDTVETSLQKELDLTSDYATPELVVLVCGKGNGAHALAGITSFRENTETRVLTLPQAEAKKWARILKKYDFIVSVVCESNEPILIKAKPKIVSCNPAEVVPGSHLIILPISPFIHEKYFRAIEPYLEPDTIIVGMPGNPGFEFQCFDILKEKARLCTIVSLESFPWTSRIREFGKHVEILEIKESLFMSIINGKSNPQFNPLRCTEKIIGTKPVLTLTNNYLESYLMTKTIIHPAVMCGKWKGWDGKPLRKLSLFYRELDEKAAEYLIGISDEIIAIAKALQSNSSSLDMSNVSHLLDWYRSRYYCEAEDNTELLSCLSRHSDFKFYIHPMIDKEGELEPNFRHRYLLEDVPNGLVVLKGLGLITGVYTHYIDEVLAWCQNVMGKEYMVGLELKGKDIEETRCPQRYNFNTIEDLTAIMENPKVNVLICGGGNAAHVATGLASSCNSLKTSVLTLYSDEAERWANSLKDNDFIVLKINPDGSKTPLKSKPELVTKDPVECVPSANVIIFAMPAFAHETYLIAIEPYIKENVTIVGLPGQPGFEFQCFHILKSKAKQCTIMSFETLPWACRISEFGKSVDLLGVKQTLSASILKGQSKPSYSPLDVLQVIMGEKPNLKIAENYLEMSLFFAMVHPALMYGKWKDWDGNPLDEKPLFYQGVDSIQVKYVDGISTEMIETARAITKKRPNINLSGCIHIFDWFKKYYSHSIADKSSLLSCMKTNRAYDGLTHPMKEVEDGKFVPDFNYRYLTEDIPFGLAVTKGLAEIAGYDTPVTDEVMLWCQEKIGKEYLVDQQLKGKDLSDTRAPQRFGFRTLDDLEALM